MRVSALVPMGLPAPAPFIGSILGIDTAQDVSDAMLAVNNVIAELTPVFASCTSMPAADRAQWTNLVAQWDAFIDQIGTAIPFTNTSIVLPIEAQRDVATIQDVYAPQFAQWQTYAAQNCGSTTVNQPAPPATPSTLSTFDKWAIGIGVAGVVGFVAVKVARAFV